MGLGIMDHLQRMFDIAQEQIGPRQRVAVFY